MLIAEAPGTAPVKVFVSYAFEDAIFVRVLVEVIEKAGFEPLFDRHDMPHGEDWRRAAAEMIAASEAVVLVLTDDWSASSMCLWQVNEARRLRKHIQVVTFKHVSEDSIPKAIAPLARIPCWRDPANFSASEAAGFAALGETLRADTAWLRQAEDYRRRTANWAANKPGGNLLAGEALKEARAWREVRPAGEVVETAVLQFIEACEAAEEQSERDKQGGWLRYLAAKGELGESKARGPHDFNAYVERTPRAAVEPLSNPRYRQETSEQPDVQRVDAALPTSPAIPLDRLFVDGGKSKVDDRRLVMIAGAVGLVLVGAVAIYLAPRDLLFPSKKEPARVTAATAPVEALAERPLQSEPVVSQPQPLPLPVQAAEIAPPPPDPVFAEPLVAGPRGSRVRSEPSTGSAEVVILRAGTPVTITEVISDLNPRWFKVALEDGRTGYIREDVLAKASSPNSPAFDVKPPAPPTGDTQPQPGGPPE